MVDPQDYVTTGALARDGEVVFFTSSYELRDMVFGMRLECQ